MIACAPQPENGSTSGNKAAGIPAKTIQRWWRQIQDEANGLLNNEQQPENPATTPKSVVTSGYKPKPQEIAKRVEALVEKGASIREAAKAVADETGKTPSSVRQAFVRERDKLAPEDEPSEAWQRAKEEKASRRLGPFFLALFANRQLDFFVIC